tara:strand:- start:33 stop:320 length:288 start_codon:yes stop_codon:yes gene_type:complete
MEYEILQKEIIKGDVDLDLDNMPTDFDDIIELLNKQEELINKQSKLINMTIQIIDIFKKQIEGIEMNELLYKKQIGDLQEEIKHLISDLVDVTHG